MTDGPTDDQLPRPAEPTGRELRDARRAGHEIEKDHRTSSAKSSKNEKRGRKGKASKGNKGHGGGHQHGTAR